MNVEGVNSTTKNIDTGVAQGSIMGPLLFIIYINDFVNCSSNIHKILFVDDTNLFISHKNMDQLEKHLNEQLTKGQYMV